MKNHYFLTLIFMLIVSASLSFGVSPTSKTKTIENLKAAFTGETGASAKYEAYAKKARQEGFIKVALLFEAASISEKIHANNHKAVLENLGEQSPVVTPKFEVKSTNENLQDAINGETYEVVTMYPDFIKTSSEASISLATLSFNYAYQTEMKHKEFYKRALEKLNSNAVTTLPDQYFVCPTCGNTYDSQSPKRCGLSMTAGEKFIIIK